MKRTASTTHSAVTVFVSCDFHSGKINIAQVVLLVYYSAVVTLIMNFAGGV